VKKLGLPAVAGQLLFQAGAVPALRRASRSRARQIVERGGLGTEPMEPRHVRRVTSANSDEAQALLRELRPSVVIVNGTRILSKKLLSSVDAPFINMHAGITPRYRGVHGGYWALAEGLPRECGVTVHLVDAGVDTGAILGQARIDPTPADNFATYPLLQFCAGLPILKQAVRQVLESGSPGKRPSTAGGESRQWYHPTIWEYLKHRVVHGVK
jgi:methionyl-tRNA formyltransferase